MLSQSIFFWCGRYTNVIHCSMPHNVVMCVITFLCEPIGIVRPHHHLCTITLFLLSYTKHGAVCCVVTLCLFHPLTLWHGQSPQPLHDLLLVIVVHSSNQCQCTHTAWLCVGVGGGGDGAHGCVDCMVSMCGCALLVIFHIRPPVVVSDECQCVFHTNVTTKGQKR